MSNRITITDFSAPELDIYARYTEAELLNKQDPKKGIFIAESPKVIERALDAGCEPISVLAEDRWKKKPDAYESVSEIFRFIRHLLKC